MFEYLDVDTRKFVEALSLEEVYEISVSTSELPSLKSVPSEADFWSDMCILHFQTKPIDSAEPKQFFAAQYLFSKENYKEAYKLGHPMGLYKLIEQELVDKNYKEALEYGENASKEFGALGGLFYVIVCQTAIINEEDPAAYAQMGMDMLEAIKDRAENPKEMLHLENSEWKETINKEYGGYSEFLKEGKEFFEQHLSPSKKLG